MTAAVSSIFDSLMAGQAPVSAAAVRTYVERLSAQTAGYRSTLQSVLERHARSESPASVSDEEGASASTQMTLTKGDEDALPLRDSAPASCSSSMYCGDSSESESDAPSCGRQAALAGGRVTRASVTLPGAARACVWHVTFSSHCEHHVLPFYGALCVVVVGAAQPSPALLRDLVDLYCCRLQIQERITHQVADALRAAVPACAGVLVVCDATHMCMVSRGVEKHSSSTVSTAVRGVFAERAHLKAAALRQLVLSKRPPCACLPV